MKQLRSLAAAISFVVLSFAANAQSKTGADYFAGKWKVLITGTPYGDLKMNLCVGEKR